MAATLTSVIAIACGTTAVQPDPNPDPGPGDVGPGVVSPPPTGATTVAITLAEWSVTPDEATVQSSLVYFLATNAGAEAHELAVIQTDLPPDELPAVDGRVPEDEVGLIGEIEPFASGTDASMVLDLPPGKYALICNIVQVEDGEVESHYELGMYTAFTVE